VEQSWKVWPERVISPVHEKTSHGAQRVGAGHVQILPEHRGTSSKGLNTLYDDSETSTVRERRKEPRRGSEIEPETVLRTSSGSLRQGGLTATFCIMGQRVTFSARLTE